MLPELFCDRMRELLGEGFGAFEESLRQDRRQALRLNSLKVTAEGETADPGRMPFGLTEVPWAREGYYFGEKDRPGRHPYHAAGVYYIQEPSAMAPVELLDPRPGERILDLCAAPGGKSTQIGAAMRGRGILISNDIHPARARILSENLERMGVVNACVTNEKPERLAEAFPGYFDRILVDAPCSGEGMFRKNEDACGEWSPENVALCAGRQDGLLRLAAGMLRPGGRLVYSTCTFAPEENEGSVSRFVEAHPEFRILSSDSVKRRLFGRAKGAGQEGAETDGEARWGPGDRTDFEGALARGDGILTWTPSPAPHLKDTLRLWPQFVEGEGHFAAVLEKDGGDFEGRASLGNGGPERAIPLKELGEFSDFMRSELLSGSQGDWLETGRYLRFGDQIYRMAPELPGIKGLKVLRPGLHMGSLKRNRFEPAHGLALALPPLWLRHIKNLSSGDGGAADYLRGRTFPAEGEKGWYLVCVDGFGLGWGKLAGGVMKNHYPKGLRTLG